MRSTARRIRRWWWLGPAVAALAACGATAPAVPRIPPGDQLDVAAVASRPCDLLRADRAARLQLTVPGVVVTAPEGTACRMGSAAGGRDEVTVGVDPARGLDDVYAHRADHLVFRPGMVGGYPGVDTADGPGSDTEPCTVEVGVADHGLVVVRVDPAGPTPAGPDACQAAHQVATVVIGQLNGGTP